MAIIKKIVGAFHLIFSFKSRFGFSHRSTPPNFRNISYGNAKKQVFDLWQGQENSPTLIFFHGGGFITGKKYFARLLRTFHKKGINVAAVNYRLANKETNVTTCIEDAAKFVVFLKENADRYKIDPNKIAASGNSAGGLLALCLACNPNILGLTYDNSICCASLHNAPTSLDPEVFKKISGKSDLSEFWILWRVIFGIRKQEELISTKVQNIVAKYSPDQNIQPSTPPIYLQYTAPQKKDSHLKQALHHYSFGIYLRDILDKKSIKNVLRFDQKISYEERVEFLSENLNL